MPGFALLALLGVVGQGAAEHPPLSWESLRGRPPESIAREVFGAFGEGLYLLPGQIPERNGRLRLPLRYLRFQSRPRASYRAGVCETDWISLELERAPPTMERLDAGMRPRRLTQLTNYIVQDLAKVRDGGPSVDEMPALEEACAAIDPREAPTIVADTAFDITGTVPLVADLIQAARKGKAPPTLQCKGDQGDMPQAECLALLASLRPEAISTAHLEAGCGRKAPQVSCRTATAWRQEREIRIVFEMRHGAGRVPVGTSVEMLPDIREVIN